MPWIALLMLATILILIDNQNKDNKWIDKNVLIIIFLITATLHIFFAQNNHLFRYEAYLVCFGMFVITYNIDRYIAILKSKKTNKYTVKRAIIVIVVTYLVMCPIVIRGFGAFNAIPKASHNIYEQQYQMANFVHEYYDGDLIILNDIGLVNYISDIKLIDLEGLGTLSVAKQKLVNKTLQKSYINEIAMQNNASLAIVYDFWYKDNIPIDWTKVGTWTIPNNVICGNETISFYAINPNEVEPLQKHLKEFNLPSDVKQEILYNKRDR